MEFDLSPDLAAFIDRSVKSGRFASPQDAIHASLALMHDAAHVAASEGAEFSNLRRLFSKLQAAKDERDFIIALTNRARAIPHPEAIMQMVTETLGLRLQASRVGFFHVLPGGPLEYAACWTDGSVSPLQGRLAPESMGKGVFDLLASGRPLVAEDCQSDSAVDSPYFLSIQVVSLIAIPLFRERLWQSVLYIHDVEARSWTTDERLLIKEVAELTWDAVERARALASLHNRMGQQASELSAAAADIKNEQENRSIAESQVSQLQKMEQVGQLTGGIAHDFNNMLAVIIGGLNLAQRRIARGDANIERYLENALDGAQRAANLTQRLLAFSRLQPLAPIALDANRFVLGMQDLLMRSLGEAVHLEFVTAAGLWVTKVDPSQLENTIMNLAVNSRDAMPSGGKLTIETANVHVDEAYSRENEIDAGQYINICVTDTGGGIPPALLDKVFEPFFTTKGIGKGTGLGLSQVFGFVKQSNGNVKVYSEIGHGTTVKVYLPRFYGVPEAILNTPHDPNEVLSQGNKHEIILVVEDEERVRALSVDALRERGYTVLHAASGREALQLIESGQDVRLLFTDIVMPEMMGPELADRAKAKLPHLKIVYTTGYTRNAVVHNGILDPGVNFLAKPFRIDQLAALIRRVLESNSA